MDYSYIDKNYEHVVGELRNSCENLPEITVAIKNAEIEEIESELPYPVGVLKHKDLPDICIFFMHYETFDEDRENLLQEIKNSKIEYVMNVSASIRSIQTSMELAKKYDFIYTSVGVHPSETEDLNEKNFKWLKEQTFYEQLHL